MEALRLLLSVPLTFKLPSSPYPEAFGTLLGLLVFSGALNFHLGVVKIFASLSLFGVGVHTASSKFDLLNLDALLAQENRFDVFLILGLASSYVGDVVLIASNYQQLPRPKSPDAHSRLKVSKFFHSLTHISYILAFTFVGLLSDEQFRRGDFIMTIVFGWLFGEWLGLLEKERQYNSWFEIPQELQPSTVCYSFLIVLMVATATATDTGYQRILGAWLFLLSELFTAFNAFGVVSLEQTEKTQESRGGERWSEPLGWICYYCSQFLLVGCI